MNQLLLTLGTLTLGGSAAVAALALAGRSTRRRYGARWRCLAWLLLCLRLAVPLPLMPHTQARAPIQVDLPQPVPVRAAPPPTPGPQATPTTPARACPARPHALHRPSECPLLPSPSGGGACSAGTRPHSAGAHP